MGAFGSFKINEDINHFVVGETEGGPLAAGEYAPTSLAEFDALAHVASVSVQAPGDTQSHTLVDLLTGPDEVVPTAAEEGASAPLLPEAPAAPAAPPASPPLSGEGDPASATGQAAQGSPPASVPPAVPPPTGKAS
jgi:hypothetical protein